MPNIWRIFMISKGYKKQLIVNTYNTQLTTRKEFSRYFFNAIQIAKKLLLFERKYYDKFTELKYKYKFFDNASNIFWFSVDLINLTNGNSSEKIVYAKIINILEKKQNIEDNPDYAKYLEDVYD